MYKYEEMKKSLFTEEGMDTYLLIRDNAKHLIEKAGCVRMQEAISVASGNSWLMLACVDRMVEKNELREITNKDVPGQNRIFVSV